MSPMGYIEPFFYKQTLPLYELYRVVTVVIFLNESDVEFTEYFRRFYNVMYFAIFVLYWKLV